MLLVDRQARRAHLQSAWFAPDQVGGRAVWHRRPSLAGEVECRLLVHLKRVEQRGFGGLGDSLQIRPSGAVVGNTSFVVTLARATGTSGLSRCPIGPAAMANRLSVCVMPADPAERHFRLFVLNPKKALIDIRMLRPRKATIWCRQSPN